MTKCYLSKHGYVLKKECFENEVIENLRKTLVATPITSGEFYTPDASYNVYIETKNKMYIPKMYGIKNFGMPELATETYHGTSWGDNIEFKGSLMEHQMEPCNMLIDACQNDGGGILSLSVGMGKTVSALYVISKLQGKTLIVVNKITLMKQWEKEIETFLPNARVGILQGSKNVDIDDKDIVIAMLQSLARIDYPDVFFKDINTTIFDEVHNISSKTFSKIFFKLTSRYTIGLTATPQRSDGCENVFKWHIGDIVFKSGKRELKGLEPKILNLKLASSEYKEVSTTNKYSGKVLIQFTSMLTELVNMPSRNLLICDMIKHYITENRKILVLSERRAHLLLLKKMLDNSGVDFTYGLFLGSMKSADLEKSKGCSVILATISAFGEGVSVKEMDTLILTTPKKFVSENSKSAKKDSGKLEQIIGRILRKEHTERNPLIVDIQDDFSVYKYQSYGRQKFYKSFFTKSIFKYKTIDLDNYDGVNGKFVDTNGKNVDNIYNDTCLLSDDEKCENTDYSTCLID